MLKAAACCGQQPGESEPSAELQARHFNNELKCNINPIVLRGATDFGDKSL